MPHTPFHRTTQRTPAGTPTAATTSTGQPQLNFGAANDDLETARKRALGTSHNLLQNAPSGLRNLLGSQIRGGINRATDPFRGLNAGQVAQLQYLQQVINQGGLGPTPEALQEQLDVLTSRLDPSFKSALAAIDQDAARRGVFRSGIPLSKKLDVNQERQRVLADAASELQFAAEQERRRSLMTALSFMMQMMQQGEELFQFGERERRASQNAQRQGGFNLFEAALNFIPVAGPAISSIRQAFGGGGGGNSNEAYYGFG